MATRLSQVQQNWEIEAVKVLGGEVGGVESKEREEVEFFCHILTPKFED